MAYQIKDNTNLIVVKGRANIAIFLRIAADVLTDLSTPNTPMSLGADKHGKKGSGNLRRDIIKTVKGNTASVTWQKEYASYQERGRRKDGSRVVKRYTTSGTGAHFAENAAKQLPSKSAEIARRAGLI